jgi:hypothetical protein
MFEIRSWKDLFWRERKEQEERESTYMTLYNACASPSINRLIKSRRISWVGHAERMSLWSGDKFESYKNRYDNNIKCDLNETEYEVVDRIHLAQHTVQWRALVKTVMNRRVRTSVKPEQLSAPQGLYFVSYICICIWYLYIHSWKFSFN